MENDKQLNLLDGYVYGPYIPIQIGPPVIAKINSKYTETEIDKSLWGEYCKSEK